MKLKKFITLPVCAVLALSPIAFLTSCTEEEEPAEEISEAVEEAGEAAEGAVEDAGDAVEEATN